MRSLPISTVILLVATGCSAHYADATRQARALSRAGAPDKALEELEAQSPGLDPLLAALDRAMFLRQAGRYRESADVLLQALDLDESRDQVSLSQSLLGTVHFRMGSFNRQAAHALLALNFLQLGDLERAAVEGRRTDLLQNALTRNEEALARREELYGVIGLSPEHRPYLERWVAGRYLAGLAHELEGRPDDAFIDYMLAARVAASAPLGAPTSVRHLGPTLIGLARQRSRQELPEIERLFPDAAPVSRAVGELVVLVEAGRIPNGLDEAADTRVLPTRISVAGTEQELDPLTSLENLVLRRGSLGALRDMEREPETSARLIHLGAFMLLPPIGAPFLFRNIHETLVRNDQGWYSLPAELQATRLPLPPGVHEVELTSGTTRQAHEVRIEAGKLTLLTVTVPASAKLQW